MVMRTLHKQEILEQVFIDEASLDLHFVQEEGSVLRLFFVSLNTEKTDIHVLVEQQGPHCTTELYGIGCLLGSETLGLHTDVRHLVGQGVSRQLFKYVLSGHARGEFYGQLYIAQDAQQTDSQQTNRNILLSSDAVMRTRPQLEIYADDVKASHGATTGQLDDAALFYMQQRGIAPDDARRMLIAAFLGEVLERLPDSEKEKCDALLQRKLPYLTVSQ